MNRIAIFASGNGTNAQCIAEYFSDNNRAEISLILSNKADAYVLTRASKMDIPSYVFNRQQFYNSNKVLDTLRNKKIDWVVLAGFLWLVPLNILQSYPDKIINIHPALLPKYGGKGMYGPKVHEAVLKNRDQESGISIHYVNAKYDDGAIIFQAKCQVESNDTPDTLASKVHKLEYTYYPKVIETLLEGEA